MGLHLEEALVYIIRKSSFPRVVIERKFGMWAISASHVERVSVIRLPLNPAAMTSDPVEQTHRVTNTSTVAQVRRTTTTISCLYYPLEIHRTQKTVNRKPGPAIYAKNKGRGKKFSGWSLANHITSSGPWYFSHLLRDAREGRRSL